MASNLSRRPTDGRRTRIKNLTGERTSVVDRILTEIGQRSTPRYNVGQKLVTPEGVATVLVRYFSSNSWKYQFAVQRVSFKRRFHVIYDEEELKPIVSDDAADILQQIIIAYQFIQ